jgi:hypothetical protein
MVWRLSFLRRAFVTSSVAWFGALPLATLAASEPHSSSAVYLCSVFVYLAGSVLCHQIPARSFFLWGSQMPVCARCTGIYAGAAVSALMAIGARRLRAEGASACLAEARVDVERAEAGRLQPSGRRSPKGFALHGARSALFVAVVPTAATLVYEWTTGQTPANWIRAAAGVPIGVVVAWIVCGLRPEAVEG